MTHPPIYSFGDGLCQNSDSVGKLGPNSHNVAAATNQPLKILHGILNGIRPNLVYCFAAFTRTQKADDLTAWHFSAVFSHSPTFHQAFHHTLRTDTVQPDTDLESKILFDPSSTVWHAMNLQDYCYHAVCRGLKPKAKHTTNLPLDDKAHRIGPALVCLEVFSRWHNQSLFSGSMCGHDGRFKQK